MLLIPGLYELLVGHGMGRLGLAGLLDATLLLHEVLPCARLASLGLLLGLWLGLLRRLFVGSRLLAARLALVRALLTTLGLCSGLCLDWPKRGLQGVGQRPQRRDDLENLCVGEVGHFAGGLGCTYLLIKNYYSNFFLLALATLPNKNWV